MQMNMAIEQGVCQVHLHGDFVFNDNSSFREVLTRLAQAEVRQVIIHLNHVEFVDSAALGMLLLAREEAQKHHKSLILSGASGQVARTFEMARFSELFILQ